MNNKTFIPTKEAKELSKILHTIHKSRYSSISKIEEENLVLYNNLLLCLYNFVCNNSYNTVSNQSKLNSYTKKYGNGDSYAKMQVEITNNNGKTEITNQVIGMHHGDIKHEFFIKMLTPICKGKNKGKIWLDSLLTNTPYEYWIPTIQTSANNFLLDKLDKDIPISIDEPITNKTSNLDNNLLLKDTITKKSPFDKEISIESDIGATFVAEEIISLLLPFPDELIAFADAYTNEGKCKANILFQKLQHTKNPQLSLLVAISSLLPTHDHDITTLMYETDCSAIERILTMDKTKGATELSRCYYRAKKKIITSKCLKTY